LPAIHVLAPTEKPLPALQDVPPMDASHETADEQQPEQDVNQARHTNDTMGRF